MHNFINEAKLEKNGYKAFTLAEVLITLGIIGVVAALTIPTLIANNQKTQYVTALKKAYTQANQALIQMAADNGCVGDLACTGFFSASTDNQSLGSELAKYFKITKNCETLINGCFSDNVSVSYDGSMMTDMFDDISNYRFITSDGIALKINNYTSNCDENNTNGVTGNMSKTCGYIIVDVNSAKAPNNFGRDIFFFYITNGKGPLLYPWGGADDGRGGSWKDGGGNPQTCYSDQPIGTTCAGRIIEEGWKMNY